MVGHCLRRWFQHWPDYSCLLGHAAGEPSYSPNKAVYILFTEFFISLWTAPHKKTDSWQAHFLNKGNEPGGCELVGLVEKHTGAAVENREAVSA